MYIKSGKSHRKSLIRTLWRGAWDEEEIREEVCILYIIGMFYVENILLYYLAEASTSEESKWEVFLHVQFTRTNVMITEAQVLFLPNATYLNYW